jgi:citrate synthase
MSNLSSYMDACIKESLAEAKAREIERVFHHKIYLTNLIERAEKVNEQFVGIKETAYRLTNIPDKRHRMAKELAEELLAEKGDDAWFYCVEKLANDRVLAKSLWRDVLTYLDEMKGKPNET